MQGFSACELSQYLTTLVLKLLSSIVHDVLPNHISTFGANDVLIVIHSYPNMNTYIHILYTHSGCSRVFQHQHKSVGSMVSMMVPAKHIAGLSLSLSLCRYTFKRLRWMGNKTLSFMVAILFVSLWHGVWPGYLLNFSLEFFGIYAERTVRCI